MSETKKCGIHLFDEGSVEKALDEGRACADSVYRGSTFEDWRDRVAQVDSGIGQKDRKQNK